MHSKGSVARVEGGMVAWDLFGRTTLKWSPDHSSEEWTSEGPEGSHIDPVPSSASSMYPGNEVINRVKRMNEMEKKEERKRTERPLQSEPPLRPLVPHE